MNLLKDLFIVLLIGLLIGLERDDSWKKNTYVKHPPVRKFSFIVKNIQAHGLGGVRTFILLSLLGYLGGTLYLVLGSFVFPVLFFSVIAILIFISYILNYFDKNTFGLTTELAIFTVMGITMAIGMHALSYKASLLIIAIVSIVLSFREEFRNVVATFNKKEVKEILEFLVVVFVILPWLPDHNYTLTELISHLNVNLHLGFLSSVVIINPFRLWLVVVFISSLNFVGYFIGKLFKSTRSMLLLGAMGGLVSSTTVTELLAMRMRKVSSRSHIFKQAMVITLIANAVSFLRIPLVVLGASGGRTALFNTTIYSLVGMFFAGLLLAWLLLKTLSSKNKEEKYKNDREMNALFTNVIFKSPLMLSSALKFGLLFLAVSILTQVGKLFAGQFGVVATTLFASATGMDAVSIILSKSVGTLITLNSAAILLVTATIVNLYVKVILAAILKSFKFAFKMLVFFTFISLVGILLLI